MSERTFSDIPIGTESYFISDAVKASISVAAIYMSIAFLLVATLNQFWISFSATSKSDQARNLEKANRKETDVQLKQLIKLGLTPSINKYIDRSPLTKPALSVLTSDQKVHIMKVESTKNRRVSRYFDFPAFKRAASRDEPEEKQDTTPSHIKKTKILLTTSVKPPAPTDHINRASQEEEKLAWEEYFNEEYKRPYWVNSITGVSTWTQPRFMNVKYSGELPDSTWKSCYSDSFQRQYWHNTTTGENTWRDPNKHLKI